MIIQAAWRPPHKAGAGRQVGQRRQRATNPPAQPMRPRDVGGARSRRRSHNWTPELSPNRPAHLPIRLRALAEMLELARACLLAKKRKNRPLASPLGPRAPGSERARTALGWRQLEPVDTRWRRRRRAQRQWRPLALATRARKSRAQRRLASRLALSSIREPSMLLSPGTREAHFGRREIDAREVRANATTRDDLRAQLCARCATRARSGPGGPGGPLDGLRAASGAVSFAHT